MISHRLSGIKTSVIAAALAALAFNATAWEIPNPLPRPDGKAVDTSKPIKVCGKPNLPAMITTVGFNGDMMSATPLSSTPPRWQWTMLTSTPSSRERSRPWTAARSGAPSNNRPVGELKGDDRNIAVLARAFHGSSIESVRNDKGGFDEPAK